MKENGVRFELVEEGYGGPIEHFGEDDVHTIIRYCPKTGSISKAVKQEGPAILRDICDPVDYIVKPTLSKLWDVTFIYKDVIRQFELAIEYRPS